MKISRYIASYWNIVKYRVYRKKAVLLMGARDPSPWRKKEICSSGKNEHGTAKFVHSFISLFRSFSLRHSENTFISALQGPGDKETPKNHHPKGFWSSRDSLTNHLTPLCACTHTYPCVLGPLHSPLTLEFGYLLNFATLVLFLVLFKRNIKKMKLFGPFKIWNKQNPIY